MFQAIADPILPIFAVLVTGYIMRHAGLFTHEQGVAINRYVFYIGTPTLIFSILIKAPVADMNWQVLLRYLAAELITYALFASTAYFLFRRNIREAILLGMAASFANHVFFVLPIAVLLYGADVAEPVSGILLFDVLIFVSTVLCIDFLSRDTASFGGAFTSVARNPFVYAPIFAALYLLAGELAPGGILTFAEFAGASAAPASLFVLGIVLAGSGLTRIGALIWIVVAGKLLFQPLLFSTFFTTQGVSGNWALVPLLVAAGPSGAMALVIALQYGVRTELIAKVILISTILSVVSLSVLVQ